MAKVSALKTADPELVKALEGLLEQARRGELEGFAAALLLSGSRVGMAISQEARNAPSTTIGLLWQVQYRIQAHSDTHAQSKFQ